MVATPSNASARYTTLALKIEGVGGSAGQYRLAMGAAPSWDSSGLYLPAVLLSWPDEVGSSVDFVTGTSAQTSGRFTLRQTATLRGIFWNTNPITVGSATAAVGSTSVSLQTDQTGLAGSVVHWDREAILLGTHAGGGTYTGCTRGLLGTQATRHGDGTPPDLELYGSPWSLKGRVVHLIRVPATATGYGDEVTLWTGVVQEVTAQGLASFVLDARDALGLLSEAKLGQGAVRWTPQAQTSRRRPIAGYGTTTDTARCLVVEEGSGAVAVVGYEVGSPTQGPGYALAVFSTLAAVGDFPLPPRDAYARGTWREVVSTHSAQPPTTASPGDDDLPLSQEPAKLLLQLLTTTPNANTPGANGDYDLGIGYLAGGVPAILVDAAQILAWGRARTSARVDNLWIGLEGPETLGDVVAKILRPLGAALVLGSGGRLQVAQLADAVPFGSTSALTPAQIITVGATQARGLPTSIDAVEVKHSLIPGQGYATDRTLDARQSRRLPPGARSTLEVDATAYSSPDLARASAIGLLFRYRLQPPILDLDCIPTVDLWPGDVAALTCANVLGKAGAAGVDGEPALVLGRQAVIEGPDVAQGGEGRASVRLTVAVVGLIHKNLGAIAPSAVVTAWNAGTKTLTVQANAYTSATNDYLARDSAGFFAGDVVQIADQYGTTVTATATVASVGTNTITLTATPASAPASGNIVRVTSYASAVSAQRGRWAFIADASDEVDGDPDNAYTYPVG
jgi:hypothetical protein